MVHMTGTVDRWGARRVYVITGIIKYPSPTIVDDKNFKLDMDLYNAQTKTNEEVDLEQYIDLRVKDITKYGTEMGKTDEDKDATNNELFLPDNDD
jgi:NADPH-dependent 7-cyano-7-deazaguanine reductase QueF-like protein